MKAPGRRITAIIATTLTTLTGAVALTAATASASTASASTASAPAADCPADGRVASGRRGGLGASSARPPVTVWLAGDSTMANPSGGVCPVGWGNQFAQYLTDEVTVRNSAVGGRSIQTWLYDPNVSGTMDASGECVVSPATYSSRWQAMLHPSTGMKAGDYLIIQFGINDGDRTCPRHVGTARYQQLLGAMAAAAKQRGAHPVFLTPAAAIRCSGGTAIGNRGFLTETNNAATANGVPVVDLHTLSYTLYNSLGLCPNNGDYAQGAVGAFFCNDHTHFETAGAARIAGVVASALRTQNIGLAAYLR